MISLDALLETLRFGAHCRELSAIALLGIILLGALFDMLSFGALFSGAPQRASGDALRYHRVAARGIVDESREARSSLAGRLLGTFSTGGG